MPLLTRVPGNIGPGDDKSSAPDLTTPTLKGQNYSTGRGGQGNMAKNDLEKPEIARERQDVEAPPMKLNEGPYHVGRGTPFRPLNIDARSAVADFRN